MTGTINGKSKRQLKKNIKKQADRDAKLAERDAKLAEGKPSVEIAAGTPGTQPEGKPSVEITPKAKAKSKAKAKGKGKCGGVVVGASSPCVSVVAAKIQRRPHSEWSDLAHK